MCHLMQCFALLPMCVLPFKSKRVKETGRITDLQRNQLQELVNTSYKTREVHGEIERTYRTGQQLRVEAITRLRDRRL